MNSNQYTESWMILRNTIMIVTVASFFLTVFPQPTEAQTLMSFGDSSGWVESFDEAVAQSESSGKPIMFVFSGSDWCSYCQLLEHEVLRTPEFETWSSAKVIKVMVDFPQYHDLPAEIAQQNENLKNHFSTLLKGYPTILLVRADGSVMGRTGYVAGGPMPWITKADAILQQTQRLAGTSNHSH